MEPIILSALLCGLLGLMCLLTAVIVGAGSDKR